MRDKILKIVYKKLPILTWAPKYNTHQLVSDAIAGITVALTVMPQGLAYATLAGLEPQVSNIYLFFFDLLKKRVLDLMVSNL